MDDFPTSRKHAKEIGAKRYFTGMACLYGHVAERQTSNGCCIVCMQSRTQHWRQAQTGHIKSYNKGYKRHYRIRNAEKLREKKADYYKANKSKIADRTRKYVEKNRTAVYARGHNRRAKARNSLGRFTKDDIAFLEKKQKSRCAECRCDISKKRHIDHIMPIARGGSNDRRNLQLLCPSCNCKKGAKDPIEWAQQNGRLL